VKVAIRLGMIVAIVLGAGLARTVARADDPPKETSQQAGEAPQGESSSQDPAAGAGGMEPRREGEGNTAQEPQEGNASDTATDRATDTTDRTTDDKVDDR
jgi:hypothetical protein